MFAKTQLAVLTVLCQKHPVSVVPVVEDFDVYLHEVDSMPINCYEEEVEKMAPRMKGTAGPSGVDA